MRVPKLRFNEFNENWTVRTLGELFDIVVGFVGTVSNSYCKDHDGVLFVRTLNVREGRFSFSEIQYVTLEFHEKNKKSQIYNDDILIARVGANMGMVCKVTGLNSEANSANVIIIKNNPKINSDFYSLYLNSPKGQKQIQAKGAGGAQEVLNISVAKTINVPVPSLSEQTKIANFLTAIDEKITQLMQKCDLLAQYKKGVMQQIFSQKLRFKDDDGREFPEWEEMPLSRFLIPIARKISKPENQYLAIGIRSHFKGTFQKHDSEPEKIAMEDLYEVKPNDLIVNITFAWEGAVAIAKDEDAGGLVSHRFPTFEFNEKYVKSNFFRFAYPTNHFKYLLGLCSPGGAGRNRVLNKKDFLKIELQIPCVAEQTKIANFLTAIDDKITQAQTQLETVKRYKKGLLQQMFV